MNTGKRVLFWLQPYRKQCSSFLVLQFGLFIRAFALQSSSLLASQRDHGESRPQAAEPDPAVLFTRSSCSR